MSDDIDIKDTYYGCKLALKARELEATLGNMSQEKREELRQKLDVLDAKESANIAPLNAHGTALADGETGAGA